MGLGFRVRQSGSLGRIRFNTANTVLDEMLGSPRRNPGWLNPHLPGARRTERESTNQQHWLSLQRSQSQGTSSLMSDLVIQNPALPQLLSPGLKRATLTIRGLDLCRVVAGVRKPNTDGTWTSASRVTMATHVCLGPRSDLAGSLGLALFSLGSPKAHGLHQPEAP